MSKPHASCDEVLLLVRLKREQAKRAINQIIDFLCGIPDTVAPQIAILDYMMNMIYAIELMLKLLASDWGSHNVGKMYEAAFGASHRSPKLMAAIEQAIRDQKYLLEPSSDLIEQIPEIECLFENLEKQVRNKQPRLHVSQTIEVPKTLVEYLRDNLAAYYTTPFFRGLTGKEVTAIWQQEFQRREESLNNVLRSWQPIVLTRSLGGLT